MYKPVSLNPLIGCGRLTAVSNPITVRASGSRFGSWMTDAMIPSSDSRVGVQCLCAFYIQIIQGFGIKDKSWKFILNLGVDINIFNWGCRKKPKKFMKKMFLI